MSGRKAWGQKVKESRSKLRKKTYQLRTQAKVLNQRIAGFRLKNIAQSECGGLYSPTKHSIHIKP